MSRFDKADFESSETGNWNVAADYTRLKIMKLLYHLDEYEIIATFGTSELVSEFVTSDELKDIAKIKAIKRLHQTLTMLINNTKFAVKKDGRDRLHKFLEELEQLTALFDHIKIETRNERTKQKITRINEKPFAILLKALIKIKAEVNEPLNRSDLIFFGSNEEYDPKQMKEMLIHRLSTQA